MARLTVVENWLEGSTWSGQIGGGPMGSKTGPGGSKEDGEEQTDSS